MVCRDRYEREILHCTLFVLFEFWIWVCYIAKKYQLKMFDIHLLSLRIENIGLVNIERPWWDSGSKKVRRWGCGEKITNQTPGCSLLESVDKNSSCLCPAGTQLVSLSFPSGVCLWTMPCISSVWKQSIDIFSETRTGNCLMLFQASAPEEGRTQLV